MNARALPTAGLRTPLHNPNWKTQRLKFLFKRVSRPVDEGREVVTAFRDGVVTRRSNRREDGFTFADKEIGYQGIEPGDLAIHAMDGFAGAIGVSDSNGKVSPVLSVLVPRDKDQAEPQFWAYYLRNLAVSGYILSLAKGIRERSTDFRWKDAGDLLVNHPDLPTQKRIAAFLDRETARIDELIAKKERLVEVLWQQEKNQLKHMFSKLESPHWRVRHLGKIKNGAGFPVDHQGDPNNAIPFFKVKHLKEHGLDASITHSDDTISHETAKLLRATVFPKGTIILAKIGAALLLARFSKIGVDACLDNNLAAFIPRTQIIEPDFALLGLSLIDMATMVQPGAVPSMDTEAFYNFRVPLPALQEQRRIVSEYRNFRMRLQITSEKVSISLDRLREYRAALITAAVTGQIDVETNSKAGTTSETLDRIEEEMQV